MIFPVKIITLFIQIVAGTYFRDEFAMQKRDFFCRKTLDRVCIFYKSIFNR